MYAYMYVFVYMHVYGIKCINVFEYVNGCICERIYAYRIFSIMTP